MPWRCPHFADKELEHPAGAVTCSQLQSWLGPPTAGAREAPGSWVLVPTLLLLSLLVALSKPACFRTFDFSCHVIRRLPGTFLP